MTDAFVLTGTYEAEPEPIRLVAGALTADLVNGNLRTIRHDGIEVLRAIGYIVRDRDWGTLEPKLSELSIEQDEAGFRVSFPATCDGPGGSRLVFHARIAGAPDGVLEFDVTAKPHGDFETARCGFCVLHPIVGLAGAPVTIEHVDGKVMETKLPDLIEPWQPFKQMRAITHEVCPGVHAECRMEGDTFEMEDQRNWSDASYKTYVRPLELPWPYRLKSGETFRQKVSLRITGEAREPAPSAAAGSDRIRIELGEPGPKLPEIGVGIYPEDAAPSLANVDVLGQLAPQRLLLHFDPTAGHGIEVLRSFAALTTAHSAPATLECVVPCRRELDLELAEIAEQVSHSGLVISEIAVSPSVDRQSTPPGSKWPECPPLADIYAAAGRAFPGLPLGGGMFSYFTELNRKRVPPEQLDFVTHCTCPIVHAADDLSVMQSLETLPFITRSVRAIYGDKPYRIGPSTIAMRQNPYGSATKDNPGDKRIAMANRDPRHNALFAAAWTVGYAARVADAGLEQLILSGFGGSFGVLAGEREPASAGRPRPLFHVVQGLAAMSGLTSVTARSSAEDSVAALAARSAQGRLILWLANLTAGELTLHRSDLPVRPDARVSILDARSAREAAGFSEGGRQDLVCLGAYAVARIG
jgi:D-apionolactonase